MDCPTCFQKITVPNAPADAHQKIILTGTKAGGKRFSAPAAASPRRATEPANSLAAAALVLGLLLAAGAGVYFFGGEFVPALAHWRAADIGAVGSAGVVGQQGEILTLGGSGADIWSQVDAFRFFSHPVRGDVTLIARVLQVDDTDPWAKAGLMIRESPSPDSAHVLVCVTPHNGVEFQQRSATGAPASAVLILPGLRAPYWLRLQRRGNEFAADSSADGRNWATAGTTTVAMKPLASAGLAVCSHNARTLCLASFDQVTVNGLRLRKFGVGPVAKPSGATSAVPTGIVAPPANPERWSLQLDAHAISDAPVAGRLCGREVSLGQASFHNGLLVLRSQAGGPAGPEVTINFRGAQANELAGQSLNVTTNVEKAALVTLRWPDVGAAGQKLSFEAGYALRLQFGALSNHQLPGKIYLCTPDPGQSYVAGAFNVSVDQPNSE
jgi:regulation of enolase protein 1 (concanavalin A-like superfamily)